MSINARIDAAVARLTSLGGDIVPVQAPAWVTDLERLAGGDFPADYRSFVSRYRFPPFSVGPVDLYGNEGQRGRYDILTAPFIDPLISAWMAKSGYFPIGRSSCGSYDPIAIRLVHRGQGRGRGRAPVIRVSHEPILMELPDVPIVERWSSFLELLDENPLIEM